MTNGEQKKMTSEGSSASRSGALEGKPAACDAQDRDSRGRRLFRYCPALDHPMAPSYCAERRHAECAECDTEDTLAPALQVEPLAPWPRNVEITAKETEHDWSRMPLRMRWRIALSIVAGVPFRVPGAMAIVAEGCRRTGTTQAVGLSSSGRDRSAPSLLKADASAPVTPGEAKGGER